MIDSRHYMAQAWAYLRRHRLNVTPVFKGGIASDHSNYRPISLTSIFCNLMERVIVLDMLHKYFAQIFNNTSTTCVLFADDVKLYTFINCRHDFINLQSSLDRLENWSNEHQLPISIRKCSCIVLGDIDTSDVHYSINDQPVNTVSEVHDLGAIVDSSLKFNSHISYIVAKANSRASLIHKCFVPRNPEILLLAFKVYARPLLEYATCVWSPHYNYARL